MKKIIIFFLLLTACTFAQAIDNYNSLSSALTADSVWNGNYQDLISSGTNSISIFVYSDSASATNGLKVYYSPDGVTARDSLTYSIPADSAMSIILTPYTRYYKLQYTNGSKATNTSIIQPTLRKTAKGF